MLHMTCDSKHMTHGGKVNMLSKFQFPSSYGLGVKVFPTELMSKVFVEQPGYTGSFKNILIENFEKLYFSIFVCVMLFLV